MVGINVPIPVPIAYYHLRWLEEAPASVTSTSTVPDSIRFYTKTKTVTQRWPSGKKEETNHFVIPTMN